MALAKLLIYKRGDGAAWRLSGGNNHVIASGWGAATPAEAKAEVRQVAKALRNARSLPGLKVYKIRNTPRYGWRYVVDGVNRAHGWGFLTPEGAWKSIERVAERMKAGNHSVTIVDF
jgi:hypothetical protein